MADVYIVALSLIGILVSLPGLLIVLNLLVPKVVQRAKTRLELTPGKCLVLGTTVAAAFLLWIAVSSRINFGLIRATAFLAALVGMGIGTIGAAGMARLLGDRLARQSSSQSALGNLLRGAVVYELACLFPIVGWFLFVPIASVTLMGAAVFALLGWLPRVVIQEQTPVAGSRTA